jgi:hypothetical protein
MMGSKLWFDFASVGCDESSGTVTPSDIESFEKSFNGLLKEISLGFGIGFAHHHVVVCSSPRKKGIDKETLVHSQDFPPCDMSTTVKALWDPNMLPTYGINLDVHKFGSDVFDEKCLVALRRMLAKSSHIEFVEFIIAHVVSDTRSALNLLLLLQEIPDVENIQN